MRVIINKFKAHEPMVTQNKYTLENNIDNNGLIYLTVITKSSYRYRAKQIL